MDGTINHRALMERPGVVIENGHVMANRQVLRDKELRYNHLLLHQLWTGCSAGGMVSDIIFAFSIYIIKITYCPAKSDVFIFFKN